MISVRLKDRPHAFKVVDKWMRKFSGDLQKRWPDILPRLVGSIEGPEGLMLTPEEMVELRRIAGTLLRENTWEIIDNHVGRTFAYGAQLTRMGEDAIGKQPPSTLPAEQFVDRRALEFARSHTFNEVASRDFEALTHFQTRLIETLEAGKHPSDAARATAKDLKEDPASWMRIARTETARALNQGLFDEAERLDVGYVFVPTSPTTCEDCRRLIENRVFKRDQLQGATNFKRKRENWIPAVPLHPNCTHFPLPASDWTIKQAKEVSKTIPPEGVKIEYKPPSQR